MGKTWVKLVYYTKPWLLTSRIPTVAGLARPTPAHGLFPPATTPARDYPGLR